MVVPPGCLVLPSALGGRLPEGRSLRGPSFVSLAHFLPLPASQELVRKKPAPLLLKEVVDPGLRPSKERPLDSQLKAGGARANQVTFLRSQAALCGARTVPKARAEKAGDLGRERWSPPQAPQPPRLHCVLEGLEPRRTRSLPLGNVLPCSLPPSAPTSRKLQPWHWH